MTCARSLTLIANIFSVHFPYPALPLWVFLKELTVRDSTTLKKIGRTLSKGQGTPVMSDIHIFALICVCNLQFYPQKCRLGWIIDESPHISRGCHASLLAAHINNSAVNIYTLHTAWQTYLSQAHCRANTLQNKAPAGKTLCRANTLNGWHCRWDNAIQVHSTKETLLDWHTARLAG